MMRMRYGLPCALVLLLCGCAGSRFANWDPTDYTVVSGDTLYSIAWKYELDPYELARWNNIARPYRIVPGQRLDMQPPATAGTAPAANADRRSAPPDGKVVVDRGDTLYSIARQYDANAKELARINGIDPPYLIRPGQTIFLEKTATVQRAAEKPVKTPVSSTPDPVAENRNIRWQWPVKGELLSTYSRRHPDRKGIDIAGREGDTIRASAPGRVVYSGNGLISYGNLVIIKHNRNYLSAYAHNRKLVVREGDVVESGQKIAELGRSGTETPRLHFEIRKNGKPVDPLSYLPRS